MKLTHDRSPKVAIIMSTFNGAAFVQAQLRSILDQAPCDARILIRDDGSTDDTVACIQSIGDDRITLWSGPNLGFVRSFFELMHAVPPDVDILMFSDQDDIWLPGKVDRACMALAGREERPTAYASNLRIVGPELQPICSSPPYRLGPSFANALCENMLTGCTIALNRRGLALVRRGGNLGSIVAHDWWVYLVMTALGDVVHDETETILYRQHGGNVVGMHPGIRSQIRRVKILANLVLDINRQIANLLATHGADLGPDERRVIRDFFDFKRSESALRFVLALRRFRHTLIGDVALRLAVVYESVFRRERLTHLPCV